MMEGSIIRSNLYGKFSNDGIEIDNPEESYRYETQIDNESFLYSPKLNDVTDLNTILEKNNLFSSPIFHPEDQIIQANRSESNIFPILSNNKAFFKSLENKSFNDGNSVNSSLTLTFSNEKCSEVTIKASKKLKFPRKTLMISQVNSVSILDGINSENWNSFMLILKGEKEEEKVEEKGEKKSQILYNDEMQENKVYVCTVCHLKFECRQSLGGHMSRKHRNLSLNFQKKKKIRMKRKEKRILNLMVKIEYFQKKNLNFLELDKTLEGKKKIRESINRKEMKLIKVRISEDNPSAIDQFKKDYPLIYQAI